MNRYPRSIRPFIDDEARVDNEDVEDLENGQDIEDTFINDDEISEDERDGGTLYSRFTTLSEEEIGEKNDDNDEYHSYFFDRLLAAANANAQRNKDKSAYLILSEQLQLDEYPLMSQPSIDDYPLCRVDCEIGYEPRAVLSLLNTAEPKHKLRSAFSQGSIRGHIYLECLMNKDLQDLLEKTPGIICIHRQPRFKMINPSDYRALLRMQSTNINPAIGNWVRVRKGTYKGDVGRVSATHAWGVELQLVPRITTNTLKRKVTTAPPDPRLFTPDSFRNCTSVIPISHPDGSYTAGKLTFEHGLLLKKYDYHSITSSVTEMPWNHFTMFALSGHPNISPSNLPRPQEWSFIDGECVTVRSWNKTGCINLVGPDHAEVEIPEEGVHRISWHDIRKYFEIGDFVGVVGGPNRDAEGWVIKCSEDVAFITNKIMPGEIVDSFQEVMKTLEIHVNCLIKKSKPFHHESRAEATSQPAAHIKSEKHPWVGTKVVITKQGSPRKGETADIVGVAFGQSTASSPRLELRLNQYDPAMPFQKIIVEYDDVREITSLCKLIDCTGAVDGGSVNLPPKPTIPSTVDHSGDTTPMPTELSSTPAWNPTVDTYLDITRRPTSHPTASTSGLQNSHVLLNPLLNGVKLNALVNGQIYKQKVLEVEISAEEGQMQLRNTKYGTSCFLQPEWVTPIQPSPTHYNGLLVIIKGEHCGKYGRRIHHRHTTGPSSIILAIVKKVEDAVDILTGEQLELYPDYLCTVAEPANIKNLNKDLMTGLRAAYRRRV